MGNWLRNLSRWSVTESTTSTRKWPLPIAGSRTRRSKSCSNQVFVGVVRLQPGPLAVIQLAAFDFLAGICLRPSEARYRRFCGPCGTRLAVIPASLPAPGRPCGWRCIHNGIRGVVGPRRLSFGLVIGENRLLSSAQRSQACLPRLALAWESGMYVSPFFVGLGRDGLRRQL